MSVRMRSTGASEAEAGRKRARVAEAEPASSFPTASLAGLPQVLLDRIVDDVRAKGTRDDVAALRGTCKALRRAIAPTGEDGKDELTPKGATVSVSRLKWAYRQCGWPRDKSATNKHGWGSRSCTELAYICAAAAERGQLEVLKWARKNGALWNWSTSVAAAKGGHLEVLKWAKKNGAPDGHERTCSEAARGGHLEVLKWARKEGIVWDSQTCSFAAKGGHLELLKWARKNGAKFCGGHLGICASAALGGHLEVLKWARKKGASWDYSTLWYARKGADVAARSGCSQASHLEVIKWATENGAPTHCPRVRHVSRVGYKWERVECKPV